YDFDDFIRMCERLSKGYSDENRAQFEPVGATWDAPIARECTAAESKILNEIGMARLTFAKSACEINPGEKPNFKIPALSYLPQAPNCVQLQNASCSKRIVIHHTEAAVDEHPNNVNCGYALAGWANPPYNFLITKVGKDWKVLELRNMKYQSSDVDA